MSRFTSRVYRRWRLSHGAEGRLIETGPAALPPAKPAHRAVSGAVPAQSSGGNLNARRSK